MNDMTEWLAAQIAEDERLAQEVGHSNWAAYQESGDDGWAVESEDGGLSFTVGWPEGVSRYIARNDPARALREADAKKKILKWHSPTVAREGPAEGSQICVAESEGDDQWYYTSWPCDHVRVLLEIYAGQPGYQPEWATDE